MSVKDQSGQLPGKSIVFAMTKEHAARIRDVFEEMYPQHVGLVQVITSSTERVRDGSYGDGLITKFKKNDMPRIAISVDMLDTGIDVPEVTNLIFMKPVQSRIKLWQMVGRGTRAHAACKYFDRLPDGKKTEFKVIDFWQNDFNKKADDKIPTDVPVLVSLFNTRLRILEETMHDPQNLTGIEAIGDLQAMIARIPTDSYPVRKVLSDVKEVSDGGFWLLLTPRKIDFLRFKIGPLLRFASNVDVSAETFTHKTERLRLQILQGNSPNPQILQSIAEDVSLLPAYVLEKLELKASVDLALSKKLAEATPHELRKMANDLSEHMRNRRNRPSAFLKIDLPDFIEGGGYISVGEGGKQIFVEEYRKRVEARVLEIIENHPTLEALRQGKEVTDDQLVALERTLHEQLGSGDLQLNAANIKKAYGFRFDNFLGFLRHILALDLIPDYQQVVQRAFAQHIEAHNYNADQIRFLRSVQEVFLKQHQLKEADLYEPPLTQFGRNAVERFFSPKEIDDLLDLAKRLAA